ncbi:MAG: cation:proton antiporter subunit C [Actinobacteria bacterium]|nr:cation:proton antiporter subunit C [Actinomycetota bacterium]MBU1942395.1 cation:proton antiporter subunit C [Actinomycetota bacterium]MBU2686267.1 cation:proton antiporter subunit C [Actinomycetota bacterium]
MNFSRIFHNLNYVVSALLFLMGLYAVTVKPNIIKKLIGLNIMETSVFLLIVSVGMVDNGVAPIVTEGYRNALEAGRVVNPIPQALILTGIVVAVSTTAVALSLCLRVHEKYGTLNAPEILGRDVL